MDINKIKIMMLETKCQDFLNCSSKFLTDKYELFLNSYLTKCEDSRIKRMASKLDEKYLLIKKGYQNISEWWNNYLENVKGLEQSLAQNRNETMTEGDLITYVSKNIESLNSFEENISTLLSPALIKDVSPIVDTFQGHMSNFQTMSTSVLGTNLGLNAFSFGAIAGVSTNHEKTAKNSDSDPITNQAFVHSFNMAATNANFSSNANSVLNLKSVSNSAIASDSAISSTLNLSFSKEGEKSLNSSELNDQILFQSMGGFSLAASSAAFSFRSALASQSSPATRDSEKKDSFSKTSSPTATDDKKKNVSSDSGDMATVIDDSSLAGIVRQSFSGEDWESAFERNLESAKIMSKACDVTIKDLKKQQDELQKSLDSFLLGHGYILRTEFYRPDDSIDSVKALTPEEYEKRLLNSIDYDIPDSDPEIGYNVIKRQEKAKKKALEYAIKFNEAFEKRMGISYNDYLEQLQSIENDIATIKFSKYSFDQQVKMSPYLSIMYSETFQEYKDGYNPLGEYELDKVGLFKKQNPIRYCEKLDTKFVSVNEDMVDSVLANSNLESYERFTLLSEDEKALYSFLYDEKGYKEAENYLKAMEDTLNNRQGLKEAVDFINGISDVKISVDYISPTAQQDFLKALDGVDVGDKWYSFFSTVGKGFGDGLQTFGEGFSSILSSKGMISTNQYAQMYILEGFSKDWFLTGTYEVSTSAGNMAPSIALSAAATAAAGPAGLGLSAETAATVGSTMGYISTGFSVFGNAKNQALVNGNSLASSTLYATCSGVSEVALGKLLGNIGILNENAKFALQEILNEGIEEGLQEFVDAGLRTAFLNEDVDINQLVGDSGKSFLYGVIMSTITTGGQQAIRIVAGGKAHTISSSDAVELLELLNNVEEANQKDAVLEYLTNVKNKGNVEISSPATTVVEKVSFADKVKNLSLNLFDSLGQTASTVFNGVVSVNHKINDLRTKVADNMVDTGAKVVNGVKSVFAKTSNVAESVFDTYMNFRSDVQDSVKDVTLDVIDSVVDTKVSEFEQVTTLLDTTKGSVANLLQVDVQPEDSIGTTFDTFFENVNTNISEILHSRISLPKMFIGMFYSSFGVLSKLVYTPVKNNGEMSKTILEDGIYHITSLENAQKILESGYVKASNIISSYGSKKAFFFAGFPNFENVAVNIPSFLEKAVAIKFDIDEADLDNFRYRSLADQAVATIGDYVFDPAKASLVYLGLMNDNGKLVYKEISGDTYNGYHTDVSADFLGKRIVNLEKNLVALAREGGNVIHNVENLVQIIRKGDVTKTAAKIVVGAKNVVSSNLSDLEGRITSLIHDYQEKVSSIDQLGPTYEQLEKKKIFDLLNNAIEKQVNEPIKVLMDEYNNLLDSDSRLSELITKGNNGEVIRIPEELVESYLHLRDLEYRMLHPEISPKMEVKSFLLNQIKVKFNETFAKISEKPLSAWNNLKDIKVSNLFDVLKQTFLSNIDRNSQSYINQLNQVNRENNPINVGELKTGIIENMPQGLSELEQARYVYLELGKKLNFNKNFNMNDVENYAYMKGLYDLEITNDTNFDSGVICANWAVVYADMLNSLGISSHVAGEHRSLSHQWVEFEIDGHYFAADATRGSLTDLARISVGEQTQEFYEIYDYSTTSYPVAKPLENFDGYLRNVDAKLNYLHDFNYPNVVESVQSSSNSIDEGLLLLSDTVLSKLGFIEAKSYLLKYVRSLDTDKVSGTDLTKFFKNGQKDIVNITSVLQEDGTYKYYALHEGLGLQEVTTNDLNALIYSGYNLENGKSIKGYEYSSIHGIASRLNSLRNSINGKVASVVSNRFRDFSNTIMPFVLLKDSQDVGDLATGTHVTNKSYSSLVDEFNQLIDSDSRLSWLLEEHDAGKTVQVPAELSETYQRLIQLKTLIENSVSASEVEEKLPNIDLNEVPDNLADFNKYMYYIRSLTDKNVPEGFSTIEEYKRAFARSIRDSGKLDQYANINYVLHLTYDPIILSELIGTEKVSELYCKLKQVPQIFADPLSKLSFEDFDRLFSDETVKKSILDLDVQDFQKIIKAFSEKELSSWLTQDTFLQKLFSLDDAAIKDVLLTSSQLYSQLSAEDFNRIFNDEHVRDVVLNMNLEEFKQIISSFNFRTVSTWLVNETMVDKVMRLSVNDFYDLMNSINYSSVDNFLESNLDFTQYERLLKSILEKFYTEDVLLQDMQYEMLIGNIIHLNMDMDSKIKQYCQQINQVTKQAENVLNEKFSNCLAPNLNRIIPVANGYYTITLKIDGKLETVPTLVMNDKIDLYRFMLRSSQYSTALLKNNLKILSVVPDERKTNLTVFDGTVNEGLHEIVLLLDGQEYRMIYNNLYGNLDLSYMADYEFKDISDIQIKQIIPLPSYSQEVDHPGVYLLKYDVNGKTFSRYLATINKDGKNILDVDQYIEKNQLIGISNVRVEEVSLNEIKDIFPKIDSFTNVFGAKYGGNQSDVAQLVEDYVGRRDLSMIEQQKAQLLNSLIEKYFPDATDLQKVNLAEFYASGGCCWMAVANAFATYMGNKDDDGISFKNKIGFDLFYMDGDQKVYNLEAIAFDMFLNYYSKEYDHINDILENETSSGIAIVDFQAKIIDYFEERNIIAQYLNNFVNNKMDALSTILDFSNYFSILLGNHFDLKQISDDFNITHNKDKALSKSTVDGQISKDVGSHAMLITDINENLDLIVSSWSKKYEFLFDSLQEYKDRHSYANILSLIFYETD